MRWDFSLQCIFHNVFYENVPWNVSKELRGGGGGPMLINARKFASTIHSSIRIAANCIVLSNSIFTFPIVHGSYNFETRELYCACNDKYIHYLQNNRCWQNMGLWHTLLILKASKKCEVFWLIDAPEYRSQRLVYGFDERPVDSQREQETPLFWETSRPTPVASHPSIQWVQVGAVSSAVKQTGTWSWQLASV
jgi:hypothetical protein